MFTPVDTSTMTYKQLVTYLNTRYKSKLGSTRKTWLLDDFVVKLPRITAYNNLNIKEYNNSKEANIPIAECVLTYTLDGIAVMQMERVEDYYKRHKTYKGMPAWCKQVDTYQVGYNANNTLVAYDHTA